MKTNFYKILFAAIMLGMSFSANAQKPFRKLAENYQQQNNYFVSELGKRTIKLYLREKNPPTETREVLENIYHLRVLSFSMTDVDRVPIFINDVYINYDLSEYIPFKVERNTFENRMVFLKESGDIFSDLLVFNSSMSNVSLVEIEGEIDLEKIALLKDALNLEGLDALSSIDENETNKKDEKKLGIPYHNQPRNDLNPYKKLAPRDGFRFWLIDEKNRKDYQAIDSKLYGDIFVSDYSLGRSFESGVRIYEKSGVELINTTDHPLLYINGYKSVNDYETSLRGLNPDCIESINIMKHSDDPESDHVIQVDLAGDDNECYTVCEGMLYFGQNGYIQTVRIDDDCGPNLLIDCDEKPISEILKLEPRKIKSIQLTTDPRNCSGLLLGEYVVLESK